MGVSFESKFLDLLTLLVTLAQLVVHVLWRDRR